MKKCLLVLLVLVSSMIIYVEAKGEELQTRSTGCEYTGAVKAKLQTDGMITMETRGGPIDFYLKDDGKKDCSSWQDLSVGDKVVVSCTGKKPPLEVTCVKKMVPPTTSSSISIGGGGTVK